VAEPDSLADIEHVRDACEGHGEIFASAVAERYEELGGEVGADDQFPILELFEPPAGERLPKAEVRKAFPRTAQRFR
jgi:hypothetical protein